MRVIVEITCYSNSEYLGDTHWNAKEFDSEIGDAKKTYNKNTLKKEECLLINYDSFFLTKIIFIVFRHSKSRNDECCLNQIGL